MEPPLPVRVRPVTVCLTVDVEPDCPPFLSSHAGIEQGLPRLLELFGSQGLRGTFFVTGEIARRYPEAVRAIVDAGHELGSHGDTHRCFAGMTVGEASKELQASAEELRKFGAPRAFRAPYLRFPDEFLSLLPPAGYTVDSSQAKYKPRWGRSRTVEGLARLPVSATSSCIRLPRRLRRAWLSWLSSPVVLFVHPWEFVDLRATPIRWDCRFNTGTGALRGLEEVVGDFRSAGAEFRTVWELKGSAA